MAISTGAAILGGSLISGGASLIGSRRAADAQSDANDAAIREQRRQFDEILRLTAPQREIGSQAMNAIAMLLGLPGYSSRVTNDGGNVAQNLLRGRGPVSNMVADVVNRGRSINVDGADVIPADQSGLGDFDPSEMLANVPGNEVIVNDMMRRIRQASPTTGGNVLTALADRVGGYQSSRLFDSLFQLAGFGPSATGVAASGASNTGNAISQLLQSSGMANASGILGAAGGLNSSFQNILQYYALQDMMGGDEALQEIPLWSLPRRM